MNKICYLLGSFGVGGYETCLYNLTKELKGQFEFYFIATENKYIHPHFSEVGNAFYCNDWDKITNFLKDNKIEILQYGNNIKYKNCAINAKIPVIIERTAGPRSCGLDRSGVSFVITSTKGTVSLIRQNYSGPLETIYNGVDVEYYNNIKPNKHFSDDSFVVCYAARMGRGQAFDILIKAVIEARKHNHKIKLLLIGDKPDVPGYEDIRPELYNQAEQLGNACIFTGMLLEPASDMAGADVYVSPARHHGLSNSAIESAALGKPIISTNVGNMNELVQNNINGYLVNKDDYITMAEYIYNLSMCPNKCKVFGQNAKSLVNSDFNIKNQAKKYEKIYIDLLNGR